MVCTPDQHDQMYQRKAIADFGTRRTPGAFGSRRAYTLRRVLIIVGTFLLVSTVYIVSISEFLTEDSVDYATAVVKGNLAELLHPHHLVYNLLLAAIARSITFALPTPQTLHFLQILNVVATMAAVCMSFLLVRALGCSRAITLWSTCFLAFTKGFWLYSSQIEVYTWAAACITGTLLCIVVEEKGRSNIAWIVGPVLSGMGMLFHQTAIFFTLAIPIYALLFSGGKKARSLLVRYTVVPLVSVVTLYWMATIVHEGRYSPGAVLYFVTSYAHSGWWGKLEGNILEKAASGFVNSIVAIEGSRTRASSTYVWGLLSTFPIAVILLVGFTGWRARVSSRGYRWMALCVPWVIAHTIFVTWWYPDNIEFWIMLLPGLMFILAILLQEIREVGTNRFALMGALGLLLVGELGMNGTLIRDNRRSESLPRSYALEVCKQVSAGDLVVTTGEGILGSYLRYFCPASVVPIHGFFGMRPPGEMKGVTSELVHALDYSFQDTMRKGGSIIVEEYVWKGDFVLGRDLSSFDAKEFLYWLRTYSWTQRKLESGEIFILSHQP